MWICDYDRYMTNATLKTYNDYATIYDEEVIAFWDAFPREFIDAFATALPGKCVLNVGSGSGRDALLLRDKGLEVACQDGSKSMVDLTEKLGFESHLAEFSEMAFDTASFDGVWAYTSLIHIPKDAARDVIKQLRTYLREDGVFAIGVIEGDTAGMVERKTMPGAERYFKKYTSQELRELIEPLGFVFMREQLYQPHSSRYISQLYRIA